MKQFLLLIFTCLFFQVEAQYCTPAYNPDPSVHIHNFNLGDIVNRNSFYDETQSYTFHTDITTDLEIGRTYPLTASGEVTAGIKGDWAIWIDFDDNRVFSSEERVWTDLDVRSTAGLLTIPDDPSIEGERRMRVSYVWTSQELDPCGEYNNGETEDYTVTFVSNLVESDYYCYPYDALDTDAFYINDFTFGNLENMNSGNNEFNYSIYSADDFSNQFVLGESYDFSLNKEGQEDITGGFSAWIDYNDNQLFEDTELVFEEGTAIVSAQGIITIPNDDSLLGMKKMRVRAERSPTFPLDPCGFEDATETEDYFIEIVLEANSTQELLSNIEFNIYPNPCTDFIQVQSAASKEFNYTIYNMYGQELISGINVSGNVMVNTMQLTAGIYVLKVDQEEQNKKFVFVKE